MSGAKPVQPTGYVRKTFPAGTRCVVKLKKPKLPHIDGQRRRWMIVFPGGFECATYDPLSLAFPGLFSLVSPIEALAECAE